MATRLQPRKGPTPEPPRTLVLRNRQSLRRVDMRLLKRIVQTLLREMSAAGRYDLAIYLVSAPEITRLNETFLRHKGSTDVITFDYAEKAGQASSASAPAGGTLPGADRRDACPALLHGEIFLCMDEAISQARRFRTTWQGELVRYAVHGVLHLLGYDDRHALARRKMKQVEDTFVRELARQFDFEVLRCFRGKGEGCGRSGLAIR